MTTHHRRFPADRLRLPGQQPRNTVRFLFWMAMLAMPFVVLVCQYGGGQS